MTVLDTGIGPIPYYQRVCNLVILICTIHVHCIFWHIADYSIISDESVNESLSE